MIEHQRMRLSSGAYKAHSTKVELVWELGNSVRGRANNWFHLVPYRNCFAAQCQQCSMHCNLHIDSTINRISQWMLFMPAIHKRFPRKIVWSSAQLWRLVISLKDSALRGPSKIVSRVPCANTTCTLLGSLSSPRHLRIPHVHHFC